MFQTCGQLTHSNDPMAKTARKNTNFDFAVLSSTDAADRRSRRGLRRSKYSVIGDRFTDLATDEVLVFEASKNEVQGIRNYMRRNFEDSFKISTRRGDGDTFEVHISKEA